MMSGSVAHAYRALFLRRDGPVVRTRDAPHDERNEPDAQEVEKREICHVRGARLQTVPHRERVDRITGEEPGLVEHPDLV